MRFYTIILFSFLFSFELYAQIASTYELSFDNAVHHEAQIHATFSNLKSPVVEFRMSRSSPGRYALHEFAKNVYHLKVTNSNGKVLQVTRPDPYSWHVSGHDGTVHLSYTLFANHGDGTYAQVDETHAHLNAPATFMYAPEVSDQEIEIIFNLPEASNWKIATQLKHQQNNTYYAKDLQYLMDSPIEISNFRIHSFDIDGQAIHMVLHDDKASDEDFDRYFENTKKIVLQQKAVFGVLPTFDYGAYYFLACYMPNVVGDGMEHRNSTILTSSRSLSQGGKERNISTVAHEFFHCWNVERIRPKTLEPFNFEEANMSGELWFAEGFTNYYDALTLTRAGVWSKATYINDMNNGFNTVWTSTGRQFFNPIEMSYQAPFVDAAKSVDDQNRGNTFMSYYSYGEFLGLALDLSLREIDLNLDDYMRLMWTNFGKTKTYYTIEDLHHTLNTYAGKDFGNSFFENYIYKSEMPDFKPLFQNVGIDFTVNHELNFGAQVKDHKLTNYPQLNSTAYDAGLDKGDTIIRIGEFTLSSVVDLKMIIKTLKVGDTVPFVINRHGKLITKQVKLKSEISYKLSFVDDMTLSEIVKANKANWLDSK